LTCSWTVCVSPWSHAFSSGNSTSAPIVQRAMSGSAVMPSCLRAISTRETSTSIHVVQVAAVSCERFMCSPIVWRMRDSGRPSGGMYGPLSDAPAPAPGRYGLSMWIVGSSSARAGAPPPRAWT
jgi:hypothetical protein